jgi:hypothetical protein
MPIGADFTRQYADRSMARLGTVGMGALDAFVWFQPILTGPDVPLARVD